MPCLYLRTTTRFKHTILFYIFIKFRKNARDFTVSSTAKHKAISEGRVNVKELGISLKINNPVDILYSTTVIFSN